MLIYISHSSQGSLQAHRLMLLVPPRLEISSHWDVSAYCQQQKWSKKTPRTTHNTERQGKGVVVKVQDWPSVSHTLGNCPALVFSSL